jgi:flagellar basal-body rod protein FlgG
MASLSEIININRASMLSRLSNLDTVASNISNINTIGYKKDRMNFQELFQQTQNGVMIADTSQSMKPGTLQTTDNPLDLTIRGEGYFSVTLPDGKVAYTRDGQFHVNAEGQLVNAKGYPLVWEGNIPQEATDYYVKPDGSVMATVGDTQKKVGTILISRFPCPTGLEGYGDNCWLETEASGQVQSGTAGTEHYGSILASTLERSNVSLSEEMTSMIVLGRSYQMAARSFTYTDQMISQAINMRK